MNNLFYTKDDKIYSIEKNSINSVNQYIFHQIGEKINGANSEYYFSNYEFKSSTSGYNAITTDIKIYCDYKNRCAFSNNYLFHFYDSFFIDNNLEHSSFMEIDISLSLGKIKKINKLDITKKEFNLHFDIIRSYKFNDYDFRILQAGLIQKNKFYNKFIKNNKLKKIIEENENIKIISILQTVNFCICNSDFISALKNLRSLRNFVIEYSLEKLLSFYSLNRSGFYLNKNDSIEIYGICFEKKKIEDLTEKYFRKPLYFHEEKFEDIEIKKDQYINKSGVKDIHDFLEKKIFNNKKYNIQKENWYKSIYICNISIHKNNYDMEFYKGWIINNNEMDILIKIADSFINILFILINDIFNENNKN